MTRTILPEFVCHNLPGGHRFYSGMLPEDLVLSSERFEALWNHHPTECHEIKIHGRIVKTPRFQQAYGEDYYYTGRVNKAQPIPGLVQALVDWAQLQVEPQLNGVLINWYDGNLGHYIGKHRDSTTNMVTGAPIVTLSFGEDRFFRLRPWKGAGTLDFRASNGTVFVMPYDTNAAYTHEVPHSQKFRGRRVSITLRAFKPATSVSGFNIA
jgi:alkylated DNA repair dioxygenase AlkB